MLDFAPLRAELVERFGARGLRLVQEGRTFAAIEPPWPGFGRLVVHDDRIEITVGLGEFTHVHFDCWEDGLEDAERVRRICAEVVAFIADVLDDKLEVWVSDRAGGCHETGRPSELSRDYPDARRGVWSGPR